MIGPWRPIEFFPNLDRVGTFEAVSEIHGEVAKRLNKKVGADGLIFAIHKQHRELDTPPPL